MSAHDTDSEVMSEPLSEVSSLHASECPMTYFQETVDGKRVCFCLRCNSIRDGVAQGKWVWKVKKHKDKVLNEINDAPTTTSDNVCLVFFLFYHQNVSLFCIYFVLLQNEILSNIEYDQNIDEKCVRYLYVCKYFVK